MRGTLDALGVFLAFFASLQHIQLLVKLSIGGI